MTTTSPKNHVVLIHGIDDTAVCLAPMARYLTERGWTVSSFNLIPANGDAGIPELAGQLRSHIDAVCTPPARVDLVGFSMGGIVSRFYLQRLGGLARVRRFVTIASPHHGTLMGFLRWNTGGRQLRSGSELLRDLNRDVEMLQQLTCTSLRTPFDLVIIPSTSARLPHSRKVTLPVLLHPWMIRDPRSLAAVAEALLLP